MKVFDGLFETEGHQQAKRDLRDMD